MKVLVTGANGIVGRHAVAALHAGGHEVHAIGTSEHRPAGLHAAIGWHRFDLLKQDPVALMETVAPDAILHLAWVTTHNAVWHSPDNIDWIASSLRLLRAFGEKGGRRFVAAGTCAEYDWSRLDHDGVCREETTALTASSLYGTAKNSFRSCAASYCQTIGLSFAWGRIFHLFGEGEAEARLFPTLLSAFRANRRAALSHGQQIRDISSSRDVGTAFAKLLSSRAEGSFNVASGIPTSIRDFALTVAAEFGGEIDFNAVAPRAGDPPILVADVSRLRSETGFVPTQDLSAEISRFVQSSLRGYRGC